MATINNNVLVFNGSLQHKRGKKAALYASDYVPAAGELLVATDTGDIRVGDGVHPWRNLPAIIINSFEVEDEGKALDALKGKELHQRISALESVTGIDCGEINAPDPINP